MPINEVEGNDSALRTPEMPAYFTQFAVRFSLVAVLLGAVSAEAADPREPRKITWGTNLRKAAATSKTTKRPLLIKVTASWCGYCQKMKKTTYADDTVVKHVNACFIPVIVDADKHEELVQSLHVEALPTTVIISPDMKILKKIEGYKNAKELNTDLNKVCKHKQPAVRNPFFQR